MDVLVTGASGLLGTAIVAALRQNGHAVRTLGRGVGKADHVWSPAQGILPREALEGTQSVVHLAGESIAGLWTPAKKRAIRDSRLASTRLLCESMAAVAPQPRVLVCASAIGYYGDRADALLTEESESGTGFLPALCLEWEAAAARAGEHGVRVVSLRLGIVLSRAGGALPRMLPPFRQGFGGPLGGGRQYMSWITLDDVVAAFLHALTTESVRGPVNAVSPRAVTNAEFTRTLGRVLRRPALLPVPAFVLRLLCGQMADELLLASARVLPQRLQASGYRFQHAELEPALRHVLGRPG